MIIGSIYVLFLLPFNLGLRKKWSHTTSPCWSILGEVILKCAECVRTIEAEDLDKEDSDKGFRQLLSLL